MHTLQTSTLEEHLIECIPPPGPNSSLQQKCSEEMQTNTAHWL